MIPQSWAQFQQHSMNSFFARRSRKRKKILLSHQYFFTLSGSAGANAVHRTLMKLSPDVEQTSYISSKKELKVIRKCLLV